VTIPRRQLMRLAAEYGVEVSSSQMARMRDALTDEAIVARVADAARLRDAAARELGVPLSSAAALRYLENGRCLAAALQHLRCDARAGGLRASADASRTLVRFAEERGVALSQEAASRRAGRGLVHAREHVEVLGRLRVAGGRHGVRIDTGSAVRRLGSAQGDERLAVSRIAARARRRQQGASHLCQVRGRGRTRAARVRAAARCGCSGCFYRLGEELSAYTAGVLMRRGYRRRDWDAWEEATQEAAIVLWESLCAWSGCDGFASYYGGNLANSLARSFKRARAIKRGDGRRPVSLFDTYVGRGGQPVHLTDLLPYHLDPLVVVIIKERILERRTLRSDDVARVAGLYEAMRQG